MLPVGLSSRWGNPEREGARVQATTPDGKLHFSYHVYERTMLITFPAAKAIAARGRFVKPNQTVKLTYELDPRDLLEHLTEFIDVVVPFFLTANEIQNHAATGRNLRILRA